MRTTTASIIKMKRNGEKIPMLTAYDYPTAKLLDELGIPMILVGDSLGMVVLGYESTVFVTMDDMVHHTKAVARGAKRSLIVSDLPFMSYRQGKKEALTNAARLLQEGGAQTVKLEGGESVADTVHHIVENGIPVMGHIGLTPQSVNQLGGYRCQGKTPEKAAQLLRDAKALEDAGAFSIVLECVPAPLGPTHHRASLRPDHRHRRRCLLRWPGTGDQRHPRHLPRLHTQARPHLRVSRQLHRRRHYPIP